MTARSQDELEAVRDICAGIAARLQTETSLSSDRLTDYQRGMLAAAGHIERRIRELKIGGQGDRGIGGSGDRERSES